MTSTIIPIKLSIIEDNHFARDAWLATLGSVADIEIIAAYPSCEAAFKDPRFASSNVVLMDIGLVGGMSGIEGVGYIQQHYPEMLAVMCTVYEDEQKIFDALCAGAVGYLLKEIEPEQLVHAIKEAASGGSPMTPTIARKVIAYFHKRSPRTATQQALLTDGERDVLELLARGESYASIAQRLFLSVDGVGSRIRRIYEKLQAHSRAEAVAKGLAQRIIKPF